MGDGWSRDEYPDDWDSRRKAVYARDGHTCQNCGAKGGPFGNNELHCHHIVPKSEGGSHAKSNLTTLCRDCHNKVHDHHIPKMSEVSSGGSSGPTSNRTVNTRASENLQRIGRNIGSSNSTSDAGTDINSSHHQISPQTRSSTEISSPDGKTNDSLKALKKELNPDDYTADSRPYVRYLRSFIDVVAIYETPEYYSDVQSLIDIAEDWYYYTKSYQQLPPSHAVRDFETELQMLQTTYSDVDDAYSAFIDRASELPEKPDECTDAERFLTTEVLKIEQIVTHAEGIKTADDVEELHHHYEQLVAVQRELLEHLDASTQVEAFQRAREIGTKLDSAMRQRMEPATTPTDVAEDEATQSTTSQRQTNHSRDASGVVDFFNDTGGYGFIKSDQTEEDVFFSMEDISGPDLTEGTKVAFDIQQAEKGPRATNVVRGPDQGDGLSKSSQEASTSSEPDLDGQIKTPDIYADDSTNGSINAGQADNTDEVEGRVIAYLIIVLFILILISLLM